MLWMSRGLVTTNNITSSQQCANLNILEAVHSDNGDFFFKMNSIFFKIFKKINSIIYILYRCDVSLYLVHILTVVMLKPPVPF